MIDGTRFWHSFKVIKLSESSCTILLYAGWNSSRAVWSAMLCVGIHSVARECSQSVLVQSVSLLSRNIAKPRYNAAGVYRSYNSTSESVEFMNEFSSLTEFRD